MKGGTGAQAGVEEVKGGSGGGSGRGGFGSNCSERRAGGSTPISFKENAVQNPLFTLHR